MKKITLLTLAILVLAGCGAKIVVDENNEVNVVPDEQQTDSETVDENSEEASMELESDVEVETASYSDPEYIDYSEDTYNELLGKEPFVLFFHADWCPTCRQMEKVIESDLNDFPNGTKIVKTDYDTNQALKSKWGVTTQSTVVIIDANGERITTLLAPETETFKAAIEESL